MPWGQIAGAVIGGVMANQAAKKSASAQRYAADQSALGYTDARPYITGMYQTGKTALDNALEQGAYTGQTYAGLNPTQMQGINYMTDFGQGLMPAANNFMNAGIGFADNAVDIYNQAARPSLDDAISYATSSPQAQSMIDAAMRDSTRRLNEQTMPGINIAASATGNTNSSRAGVAQALAQRAYDDRRADVASDIYENLAGRFLDSKAQDQRNMIAANDALKTTYGLGAGMGQSIGGMLSKAGGALQAAQQAELNDGLQSFQRQRDFELDQAIKYNAGILSKSPQNPPVRSPNLYNPQMAALSGAMQGFGFGGTIADAFKSSPSPQQPGTMATGSYKMGFGNKPYGF